MPQTNRVDPRAKQLKDHFAAINQAPRLAKQSPLIAPSHLERLIVALQIPSEDLAANADEQIRQIGKALVLSLFMAEYKKEMRDTALLQGWLFFWYSYLDPISPVSPAPSIASVITFCADIHNSRDFLHQAKRWVNTTHANDSQSLCTIHPLLSQENFGKIVLSGLPRRPSDSERRTFGNYLNAAARAMALRLESLVPEFFTEAESIAAERGVEVQAQNPKPLVSEITTGPIQIQSPLLLEAVAHHMCHVCSRLPELGDASFHADGYFEREIQSRQLRGQARVPSLGAENKVQRMSGIITGALGSGRTAFLKYLAHHYARAYLRNPDGPLAYYLNAVDFVLYARNRHSIYEFIADRLASSQSSLEGLEAISELLFRLDRADKLLLLVDDLDRLPLADQSEVLSQVAFSPAVIFAARQWQVPDLASRTARAHVGEFSFVTLNSETQLRLIDHIARVTNAVFDWRTVRRLLMELPDLAKEPLGLMVILEQAQHTWTDMTQAVEKFLEESLRRAGFPPSPYFAKPFRPTNEWSHLESGAFTLNHTLRQRGGYQRLSEQPDLIVTREMVENRNGYAWQMTWEQVLSTGLFRPVQQGNAEGLALVNLDLTLYLLAQQARRANWSFDLPPHPIHPKAAELLRRAGRHLDNLKHPNRDLRPKAALPPPPEPEPKPWWTRFPEFFRSLT